MTVLALASACLKQKTAFDSVFDTFACSESGDEKPVEKTKKKKGKEGQPTLDLMESELEGYENQLKEVRSTFLSITFSSIRNKCFCVFLCVLFTNFSKLLFEQPT